MYSKDKKGKYSHNKPKKDITGQIFNDLTVLEWLGFKEFPNEKEGKRRSIYKCQCKCGNFCEVEQSSLYGNTKSCGCRIKQGKAYKGPHYSTVSYVFNNYKQSAKKNDRAFDLSRELFEKLISSDCYYCGLPPSIKRDSYNNRDKESFYYNGIDRKDNNQGYIIENSVPCCTECNFLKKDYNEKEFLELIKRIYEWKIKSN